MTDLEWAAQRFGILARNLKDAGETGLRRELYKAVGDAAAPAIEAVRSGLPDYMPDRYAATLSEDLRISVSRTSSASNPAVRIRATGRVKKRKLTRLEVGILSHPVFGNREVWKDQTSHVVKGFFTGPIERQAPRIREEIERAVEKTLADATRST